MTGHLNLIKTDYKETEKRVFPRFPFSYLIFKGNDADDKAFEVRDISVTGMQICLRDGGHSYSEGQSIKGKLHWQNEALQVEGQVKWSSGNRLGVEFNKKGEKTLKNFLSAENFTKAIKPIHKCDLDLELPANLKYWLRSDGPFEVFVWQHTDGEISGFHIICMKNFIGWEDGKGLRTGFVLTHRDLDTPLNVEEEFVFEIDESLNQKNIDFAASILHQIPREYLTQEVIQFIQLKLGC